MGKISIEFIKAAFAIVALTISAKLSIGKCYNEKWWEKCAAYYLELIDVAYTIKLNDSYRLRNKYVELAGQNSDPSFSKLREQEENELSAKSNNALNELERLGYIAPLVMNDKTATYIKKYLASNERLYNRWHHDEIDDDYAYKTAQNLSSTLLNSILDESKKVLKVK